MRHLFFAACCAISLTACQSAMVKPPHPQPEVTGTVDLIQLPVPDKGDVTYLARDLMPGRYQSAAAVYGGANNGGQQGGSTASGTAAGATAAGAMGQSPLSSGGAATVAYTSEAVGLIGGLAGGKSAAVQSGHAYLPESVNGKRLDSDAAAREFVRLEIRKRIEEYGRITGRTVSCFDQCDSFFPTYKLAKTGGHSWRAYDPPALYATFYLRKPLDKRKSTNGVLDKILRYPLAWDGICFIALTANPPEGTHAIVDGESVPEFPDRTTFSSPLERTLLRVLTKDGLFAFGAQNWKEFAWNGRVFALGDPEPTSLIKYEIAPATDQD